MLAKCIHKIQNSPCFVDFGNTNVDRNVVDDGETLSISSLVDDISKIRVDTLIKW
jgi:hypothetical protein